MGKSITDLSSVATVGLDLAKHVFQVHGVDASGRFVVAKAIRRNKLLEFVTSLPAYLVGLEASGPAHHRARELIRLGHERGCGGNFARRSLGVRCGLSALENQAALIRHKTREMLVFGETELSERLARPLDRVASSQSSGSLTLAELAPRLRCAAGRSPLVIRRAGFGRTGAGRMSATGSERRTDTTGIRD